MPTEFGAEKDAERLGVYNRNTIHKGEKTNIADRTARLVWLY